MFIKTIPQPPGNIIGTVNDAYVPPKPNSFTGSKHWTFERLVTIGMVPLVVTPFVTGGLSAPLDATLGALILYHSYAGFESCIIDYIPLREFGVWHKAAMGLLAFGSVVAAYGIYVLETSYDGGLWALLKDSWNGKKQN